MGIEKINLPSSVTQYADVGSGTPLWTPAPKMRPSGGSTIAGSQWTVQKKKHRV